MTDYKRNISELTPEDYDDHKKQQQTKPGRKPLDTEPKSKRTAQNRAAQRAYRERKEKRMNDLEEKVKKLEDSNLKANTESDFLRAQVEVLKQELARYRGTTDFSDLNLPTSVGHLSHPNQKSSSVTGVSSTSVGSTHSYQTSPENVSAQFPWSYKVKNSLPDLIGGEGASSTSTSPNDQLISPESSNTSVYQASSVSSRPFEHLDFGMKFEEKIEPFCASLNEACGTKECPVPKSKIQTPTMANIESPFGQLGYKNKGNVFNNYESNNLNFLNDPLFHSESTDFPLPEVPPINSNTAEDPLSFLGEDAFDISLALGGDFTTGFNKPEDPVASLTTEDSLYDPISSGQIYSKQINDPNLNSPISSGIEPTETLNNNIVNSTPGEPKTLDTKNEEDNEVVPAPEETVRCSEIWDRITSHPKYTDIDIDSLCSELKQKAKCSEKGVLINSSDVNRILEQSVAKVKK